ncbi:MAG: sugar ABC transporter ATP-binding protein, partial [Klebsiella sp.]|nr:sugar ABC transporter ATP-binding protein [Klebsiella sp.]
MRGVSKSFFGIKALQKVDLTVYAGEVHALMGENGAGKSTLMKILSGAYRPDPGGEIRIDGHPVRIEGPLGGRAAGISIIYQELSLAPNLTVAENIYLGREVSQSGLLARGAMREGVGPILTRLGADFAASTLVAELSMGQRQLVEIARALHARSKILIMDEPTTSLSAGESEKLFALIRQLRAEGLAIIYISHRMEEVWQLANRVTVFRDGTWIGTEILGNVSTTDIVRMMVGRQIVDLYQHEPRTPGKVLLEVRDLAGSATGPVSFEVNAGEVVSMSGLVGSGRTEVARLLFGADPRTRGSVRIDGRTSNPADPTAAIADGIGMVTEDRKTQGLFLGHSVEHNID